MKRLCILLILISLFVSSCSDVFLDSEFKGGDWFYLENKGAIMPVWVRGKAGAEPLEPRICPTITDSTYAKLISRPKWIKLQFRF